MKQISTKTMKALVLGRGDKGTRVELQDIPIPQPLPGEVLVAVSTAGINPVDYLTSIGKGMIEVPEDTSIVLGWDVVGVVKEIGLGVTRFQTGDKVYSLVRFPQPGHTYAEYVVAPARQLALCPQNITDECAATIPLPGLTAWQALVDTAHIAAGQRVVIHGASGAVGGLAVQIAKAHGAYVIAVASSRHHELLSEWKADEIIDYKKDRFEDVTRDADGVLDLVGGDTAYRSISVLKPNGMLIGLAPPTADFIGPALRKNLRATIMLVEPDYASLEKITTLIEAGKISPINPTVFSLANGVKALEAMQRIDHGKIVIRA